MIARMATPASNAAAGSVGTVETQFMDLPNPLALACGRTLYSVRIAYETYGTLAPSRDNVILVCHALSGDAHAAGFAKTPPPESTRDGFAAEDRDGTSGRGLGWWDGMIGPGKAFDTDRFFVVSTNLLGGCGVTTGPSSTNPATGRPYGSDFPVITVADMVRAERVFLEALIHGLPAGCARRVWACCCSRRCRFKGRPLPPPRLVWTPRRPAARPVWTSARRCAPARP